MAEKKVSQWITVNGQHVPVYSGESKQDAINRNNKEKSKKVVGYQKKIDKLNNLKSGKVKYTHK